MFNPADYPHKGTPEMVARYPATGQPYPEETPTDGTVAVWTWKKGGKDIQITSHAIDGGADGLVTEDGTEVAWYDGEGFYVPAFYLKNDGDLKANYKH